MASRVAKLAAGQWSAALAKAIRLECCDCALVHKFEFKQDRKGRLFYRAWRDNRATTNKRRNTGITIPHKE